MPRLDGEDLPYRSRRAFTREAAWNRYDAVKLREICKRPSDWTNSEVPRFEYVLYFQVNKSPFKCVFGCTLAGDFWLLGDRVCTLHLGGISGSGRPYFGIHPSLVSPIPWKIDATAKRGILIRAPSRLIVVGPASTNELEVFAIKHGSTHFHR